MLTAPTPRTGAAANRRRDQANPMELLAGLAEQFPKDGEESLFLKWSEKIDSDDELLEAVKRHTFTNLLSALRRNHGRAAASPALRAEAAAKTHEEAIKITETIKRVVFLNLILPNGKALRYCTFAECAAAGGWFTKVGKLGKPTQIVGQTVSEERLQKIK